jgi:3-hydroxymyristoyl/3-hydroxydecanoyl-(acyl carrier protein) dehydratase
VAEQRVATLAIDAGHPIFAGHFPGEPIVPGVMLLEWVMRETAAIVGRDAERLRIREAKFYQPLKPAQEAELYLDASPTRCAFRIRSAAHDLAAGSVEWG